MEKIFSRRKHHFMGQRRPLLSEETRKGTRYLMFGLIFLVVMITVLFFLKTSESAQKGYELNQLKLQQNELETENRELKLKLLDVKSAQKLEEEALKKMEPIQNPSYLD